MSTRRARLRRKARVMGGHAKFRAHQFLASNAVPLYRRVRSIDEPLADGYVFVLAHPRSGSTVLSHVLNSHPDMLGFGEHHEGYATGDDLQALAARNAFHDRAPATSRRYTLDKIVWNHHELDDRVLARPDTRFIFLVREPSATLESYRRMFHDITTDESRLHLYQTRLDGLADLAARIPDPARMTFVTYDDLIDDTDAALARLTSMLELDTPLTQEYDVTAMSGRQSWGDPSDNIKAGTIIKVDRSEYGIHHIDLDVLEAAHDAYRTSCNQLSRLTNAAAVSSVVEPAPVPESR